jgi:hypothetical protein
MDELARQKLCEAIATYGRGLADDPRKLRALLADLCPGLKREAFVLTAAAEQRVPRELLESSAGMPWPVVAGRLTRRLVEDLAVNEAAARWAVESWGVALGVFHPDAEARTEYVPSPPPEGEKGPQHVEKIKPDRRSNFWPSLRGGLIFAGIMGVLMGAIDFAEGLGKLDREFWLVHASLMTVGGLGGVAAGRVRWRWELIFASAIVGSLTKLREDLSWSQSRPASDLFLGLVGGGILGLGFGFICIVVLTVILFALRRLPAWRRRFGDTPKSEVIVRPQGLKSRLLGAALGASGMLALFGAAVSLELMHLPSEKIAYYRLVRGGLLLAGFALSAGAVAGRKRAAWLIVTGSLLMALVGALPRLGDLAQWTHREGWVKWAFAFATVQMGEGWYYGLVGVAFLGLLMELARGARALVLRFRRRGAEVGAGPAYSLPRSLGVTALCLVSLSLFWYMR